MPTEIRRELTKSDENMIIPSEHVLTLAKRVEVQRAQAAVINSLHELKKFDTILQMDKGKQREAKSATPLKMSARRKCKYCGQVCKLRWCLKHGKKCEKYNKMNHFKEVYRSSKGSMVPNIKKKDEQEQ